MILGAMHTRLDDSSISFVAETGFGLWFLDTDTWLVHVLTRALNDLQRLLVPGSTYTDILDVG